MESAGIDNAVFKPHSTRGAATSAAQAANVQIQEIMNTAGWHSDSMFTVQLEVTITLQRLFSVVLA